MKESELLNQASNQLIERINELSNARRFSMHSKTIADKTKAVLTSIDALKAVVKSL